jgi:hypothetical protein
MTSRLRRVHGLIIFYNGMPMIEYALQLIRPYVNKIIAIDGRYEHREGDNIVSTDGSLEHIEEYVDHAYCPFRPWKESVDKRTFSLQYAQEHVDNDWVLIFDSDELFFGNWRKAWRQIKHNDLDVGWVKQFDPMGVHGLYRPRLIRLHGNMEYRFNHATIYRDNTKIHELDGKLTETQEKLRAHELLPLAFLHTKMLMPKEYLIKQQEYYNKRKKLNLEKKAYHKGMPFN